MQALEIGHFRRIASFGQCLKASLNEVRDTAAQDGLFTEQICLAFFTEVGFDDAAASAANAAGISKRNVMGIAAGILCNSNQARHAAAFLIFAADCVTGALWRDHDHVNVGTRFNQTEMNVETMGKGQSRPGFHMCV